MSRERFRPREHLRKRDDFDRVFKSGCSRSSGAFVVYAAENGLGWSRLGIVTGRRLGNAVRRNFTRRRIREAYRQFKRNLPAGFDLICLPKRVPSGDFQEMSREIERVVLMALAACSKRGSGNTSPPGPPER